MKRTYWYAAMTKDEVQSAAADRMTFYEGVIETFEEHPILDKYKEGDNFNHRNTLSISRIEI
jgi:hypothetical protein